MASNRSNHRNGSDFVRSRTPFKGSNVFGQFEGDAANIFVAYSFGEHFPLYACINGEWFGNKDKYSRTTSRQQGSYRPRGVEITFLDTEGMKAKINEALAENAAKGGVAAPSRMKPSLYHRIDGWRGYSIPPGAVVGASDTGTWSDSPCPSDEVSDEIKVFQGFLKAQGISSKVGYGESSNVFCGKQWVIVAGKDWQAAAKFALEYLDEKERTLRYLHHADQSEVKIAPGPGAEVVRVNA